MTRPLLYTLAYTIPASLFVGSLLVGPWTWMTLVYVFGVVPCVDGLMGRSLRNPVDEQTSKPGVLYDVLLWLWFPVQLGLMGWIFQRVTSTNLSTVESLGLVLSLGAVTGAGGITVAHELMHRKSAFERALAEALMTVVAYPHFCIEHVFGHHRHVGTPQDPATAKAGQSVYAFFRQSLIGGVLSAWRIEGERVRRHRPGLL
ncbi:MAG: alkane 1-monooxygenase, partial [Myxococcales bacterium]|nr:alkane 1-monooxygenase [Myxococcales bacterium]